MLHTKFPDRPCYVNACAPSKGARRRKRRPANRPSPLNLHLARVEIYMSCCGYCWKKQLEHKLKYRDEVEGDLQHYQA